MLWRFRSRPKFEHLAAATGRRYPTQSGLSLMAAFDPKLPFANGRNRPEAVFCLQRYESDSWSSDGIMTPIDVQLIELYKEAVSLISFELAWKELKLTLGRMDYRNTAGHCQRHDEVIARPAE